MTIDIWVEFQHDDFYDVLSEWKMIDSAGYSVPQGTSNQVELFETIKGQLSLQSNRFTSFLQMNSSWLNTKRDLPVSITKEVKVNGKKEIKTYKDTIVESSARFTLSYGTRAGYTTVNQEAYLTPRASISYFPRLYMVSNGKIKRRDMGIRLSSGLYYQPPFYREFRTFDGQLNVNVKSQKSMHVVAGTDVYFNMWNRDFPFKFTAEAYYKYLWDVNPYEIDNVRTRYYANNDALS